MVLEDPVIGSLRVQARLLQFASDSADAGVELDRVATVGTAEFVSDYVGPQPLIHVPTGVMVTPVKVTCRIRSDGWFLPPVNGVAPASDEAPSITASPEIRLIAPLGNDLDVDSWTWTVTVRLEPNGIWSPFAKSFTGVPGELVVLGRPGESAAASPGIAQPVTYVVASLAEVPTSYRPGVDLVITPDGTIHRSESN